MAVVDFVGSMSEINVSSSVGRGGINNRNDVIVVQALLKYALTGRPGFSARELSTPDGVVGLKTIRSIEQYQRFLRKSRHEKISIDGRIDPAKGPIKRGRGLKYTIRMLNGHAHESYILNNFSSGGSSNFIDDFISKYPIVKLALPNLPVGTLGLALE